MTTHFRTLKEATTALDELESRDGKDSWVLESGIDGALYIRPINENDIKMRERIRARKEAKR